MSSELPPDAAQIDAICDEFVMAWQAGGRPRIEDYLAQQPQPQQPRLLQRLVVLDWTHRSQCGEQVSVADYCERFAGTEESCVHIEDCGIRPIWSVVNRFIAEALEGVSLADVLEDEQAAKERLQQSLAAQARRTVS